jgi:hypothetical protein
LGTPARAIPAFGNPGNFNTGFANWGNTNTGAWNGGNLNTGVGFLADNTTATSSGFNNNGIGSSGWGNTGDSVSGVNNLFTGGTGLGSFNGQGSGFFNTGITGPEPGFLIPTGIFSGDISGLATWAPSSPASLTSAPTNRSAHRAIAALGDWARCRRFRDNWRTASPWWCSSQFVAGAHAQSGAKPSAKPAALRESPEGHVTGGTSETTCATTVLLNDELTGGPFAPRSIGPRGAEEFLADRNR